MNFNFITVQIVRFVDDHQPGWVECELVDADGRRHIIIDKVPVLTNKDLRADSEYPTVGNVPCEILSRHQDENGREIMCVSTAAIGIDTKEGLSEFTLPANLVTSSPG
jgi:hypothetical protein